MTILFLEDWKQYPDACVDMGTKNSSWVELATKLRMQGIRNHAFMLALHNPKLLGVDPHSPHLTMEQMAWIAIECRQNFWYSVRNVWRAPAQAGNVSSPITANRANISMWWSFFNHITYILTQPRQTGKSFCTDILSNSLLNFLCSNTNVNLITKDDTLRVSNVKRMKEIYDELPPYLNFKSGKLDVNNTESISVSRFNNWYRTQVAQAAVKKAANTLRGESCPIIHIDEPPFQTNIKHSMPAAIAAMGAVAEKAAENGEPYGIILTTTAGKKDDDSGKYVYNYVSGAAQWSDRFYDASGIDELEDMVRKNSRDGVLRIYGSFTHRQLGKSDRWLANMLEQTQQTEEEANRDYFNVWTSGTGSSPIPVALLEKMSKSVVPSDYQQIFSTGGYILRWYIPQNQIETYMRNNDVVIGIDTSDASGGDSISVVGTDVSTGATVFVGEYNETNLITFAQWLVHVLVTHARVTLVIERRSSAVVIIDYLLMFLPQHGIDPFKRLFNWVMNDPYEFKTLYDEAMLPIRKRPEDLLTRAKKYFGFATSGTGQTSRTELYSTTLQNAMKRCGELIRDKALAEQISGLITKNGRVDHEEGGHDDLVIGYLMTHWFLAMAKNLHSYGIDSTKIMAGHKERVIATPEAYYEALEQNRIRERIQRIYDELVEESDPFMLERHERELRMLDSRLVLEDGEVFSIDSILKEIDVAKKKRLATTSYRSLYSQRG